MDTWGVQSSEVSARKDKSDSLPATCVHTHALTHLCPGLSLLLSICLERSRAENIFLGRETKPWKQSSGQRVCGQLFPGTGRVCPQHNQWQSHRLPALVPVTSFMKAAMIWGPVTESSLLLVPHSKSPKPAWVVSGFVYYDKAVLLLSREERVDFTSAFHEMVFHQVGPVLHFGISLAIRYTQRNPIVSYLDYEMISSITSGIILTSYKYLYTGIIVVWPEREDSAPCGKNSCNYWISALHRPFPTQYLLAQI